MIARGENAYKTFPELFSEEWKGRAVFSFRVLFLGYLDHGVQRMYKTAL